MVDAAADDSNHLLPHWYGPGAERGDEDALTLVKWDSPAFCNPPYSRDIHTWLAKFEEQKQLGNSVVALLPAKTGTRWWWEGVYGKKCDIIFLTGRVPFERDARFEPSAPNHDSAIVIYAPDATGQVGWWDWKAGAY